MLKLIKHAARISFPQRFTAFAAVVISNLFFLIWTAFDPTNFALHIVAVSVTGCALGALFIIQIISDVAIKRDLFKAPEGYMALLTPVPSWQILLSRTVAIVAADVIGLTIGIIGVTHLALKLGQVGPRVFSYFNFELIAWSVVMFILTYLLIVQAVFFANAMKASVFYRLKSKGFFGLLSALAALYVLSFADFFAAPFGFVASYGLVFNISLESGFNAGTIIYILISLCKSAALFFTTSYLIERKINL